MRVDINSDRAIRLRVRDVLVDGEAMPRGSVLTADEERGFVERFAPLDPIAGDARPRFRCHERHGEYLVECVVGRVEILTDALPQRWPAPARRS